MIDLKEDFDEDDTIENTDDGADEMDMVDFGYIRWYQTTYLGALPAPFDYRKH